MRERKTAFLWTLTILAALAMLLPLTARAELIFPDRYCYTNYIRYTADSPPDHYAGFAAYILHR